MALHEGVLNLNAAVAGKNVMRNRVLALILMIGIAGVFWVDSRYPALLKRYHSGTQVKAAGALTYSVVYPVDRNMPLRTRVWRTTANWLDANRVGMTFSFLFGPAALTFLGTLRQRRTKSRWLNALFGAAAGVPLGVCSNCVAPVARGLFASGMSAESVLAAMFASPALNIVVLAMTFALFPASVAVIKLVTVLFLILVFAPLVATRQETPETIACPIDLSVPESWTQTLREFAVAYAKNFWYVFRVAFPLMLLAAVLGAFVVEALPANALVAAPVTIGGIVLVALIAAFLPVPMAFDVVIAYVVMTRGVPLPYVVTILCTLGIVSVYSLSIIGKSISWRIAAAAYGTVAALGVIAGVITRVLA